MKILSLQKKKKKKRKKWINKIKGWELMEDHYENTDN